MCGIAGLLSLNGGPVDEALLSRMIEAGHHRGPDATGHLIRGNVGLAHKRLAILDLHERGAQPMSYGSRYWIVYNGEIYNYLELRIELQELGHHFNTTSDTEVILAAYTQWGHRCLTRFNGMWAFAIYDEQQQDLFLARDRFGVKPLMTSWQPGAFCFASEIKQLLPVLPKRKANVRRVLDYLITSFENHTDETFFEGINELPAGSWMILNRDGRIVGQESFYSLPEREEYKHLNFDGAVEAVSELLKDAIKLRMRSDVRVGCSLSGGLDSSIISSIASDLQSYTSSEQIIGIHAKSSQQSNDESKYARLVANHSGMKLFEVTPSTHDFLSTIDEVILTQEEPFGSPSMFMGWHVFHEAKRQNCTVMLNGQGADEAFLGYERYYPLQQDALNPVNFFRSLWLQARNSKLSMHEALAYHVYFRNAFLRISYLRSNRYISRPRMADFAFDSIRESASSYANCFAMQKLEIESLQLPHLLRYEDRNSMRHSVETRLPFLDYRLMEAAASIPLDYKLNGGWTKFLLRKLAERHLPEDVVWRKVKVGFEAPSGVWFKQHKDLMKREIESSSLLSEFTNMKNVMDDYERLGDRNRWAFFNLAAWARVFEVSQ